MANFNKVILAGRLTADPELKQTPQGVSVTTFSVAVNRKYKGADGQYPADFFNVVAWRNTAEFVCKHFSKGRSIIVCGALQNRSWEKDGQIRRKTEIIAENIQVLYRPADYRSPNSSADEPTAEPSTALPENASIPTLEIEDIF